jgi:hypothetical protein
MGWRLGADAVVILHLTFVLFVVLGGFLTWRWPRMAFAHVPVALYGVLIELVGFTCPLTPLEKRFRRLARSEGYEGGFVEHYLVRVLYPGDYTVTVRLALAAGVVAANLVAYAGLWVRSSRRRSAGSEQPHGRSSRPSCTDPS